MTTTVSTVIREECDKAVHAFWNTNVPFSIGLVDIPDDYRDVDLSTVKNVQYAIIDPLPSIGPYVTCLTGVESDVELYYQVTAVGLVISQASWVADQMRRVWSDRYRDTGNFVNELVIVDHVAQDRGQAGEFGAPRLESGLYQAVDTYKLKVSRDG